MERRSCIKKTVVAASVAGLGVTGIKGMEIPGLGSENLNPFKLKYAPHLGMFKHHAGKDEIDQINFMADQGFVAFEDNGMKKKTS